MAANELLSLRVDGTYASIRLLLSLSGANTPQSGLWLSCSQKKKERLKNPRDPQELKKHRRKVKLWKECWWRSRWVYGKARHSYVAGAALLLMSPFMYFSFYDFGYIWANQGVFLSLVLGVWSFRRNEFHPLNSWAKLFHTRGIRRKIGVIQKLMIKMFTFQNVSFFLPFCKQNAFSTTFTSSFFWLWP